MIQVNELRVGNLVYGKESGEIFTLTIDMFKFISIGAAEVLPIPLTPEIMEKVVGWNGQELSMGDHCEIAKANDGKYYLFFEGCKNNPDNPILYLHQLQNLRASITGYELTIEL